MKKVLIVDDAADNIELLRFDLEDDGFEVLAANSGMECLKLAPLTWPDIILLDIQMPEIDGIATLSRLKTNEITRDIPVIMVSADNSHETIIQTLDLGAHDFVEKPIDYPILAARMRAAIKLTDAQRKLEHANKELERLVTMDFLTNTNNRRNFFKLAETEFAKSRRHKRKLCMLMLDADHFKQINDRYGHAAGDLALQSLADICRSLCRETDIIGRMGGEEFAICCPETDLDGALIVADRIRETCEMTELQTDNGDFKFTVSVGVTSYAENDADVSVTLNRADLLLYQAKHTGRNKCVASHHKPE